MTGPRRWWAYAASHPIVVTAVIAAIRACADVARARPLGAYPVDDAGFTASSLVLHRALASQGPAQLLGDAFGLSGGPLLPLLDVGPITLLGRNVTALAVMPAVGMAVTAVLVAAIAKRLSSGGPALVAGIVAVGLPSGVLAGQSHQVVVAAVPAFLLAVWALLASEEGHRRSMMVLCGAAAAGAVLGRPMLVAYLPGLVVAGWFMLRRDRRTAMNGLLAAVTAGVLLAPWVWVSGGRARDYLLGHAYGSEAESFGPDSLLLRIGLRALFAMVDLRIGLFVVAVITVAVAGRELVRRGLHRRLPSSRYGRSMLGLASILVLGWVALLSTANSGVWFELPLEMLGVAVLASLAPILGPAARPLRAAAVIVSLVGALGIGVVTGPSIVLFSNDEDEVTLNTFMFAGAWETGLVEVDPSWRRPGTDPDPGASRWWESHRTVVNFLPRGPSSGHIGVVGGVAPMNLNTLRMSGEILGHGLGDRMVKLTAGEVELSDAEAIVVVDSESPVLPAESEATEALPLLLARGWEVTHTVPLPDGGTASILWSPIAR